MQQTRIDPAFTHALRIITERLENSKIDWAITGSLGFVLQGVQVDVHDIDLQTDERGAYLIEQALAAYSTKKVGLRTTDQMQSHYGALKIEGVIVEIMGAIQRREPGGAWEPPVDICLHRGWVEYNKMRLPVLSLTYEYQAYLRMGRVEKAHLLQQYLQEKPS